MPDGALAIVTSYPFVGGVIGAWNMLAFRALGKSHRTGVPGGAGDDGSARCDRPHSSVLRVCVCGGRIGDQHTVGGRDVGGYSFVHLL